MDELIIEDKKYVSSKRAAKLTGYAKDYVGQLCREGRVSARLVGRSWYVLEAAIQDHRFGSHVSEEPKKNEAAAPEDAPYVDSTWESPRYEATTTDTLPSINRLKSDRATETKETIANDAPAEETRAVEHLQNAWSSWFSSMSKTSEEVGSVKEEDSVTQEPLVEVGQAIQLDEGEVSVPIHSVYDLPPENLLPRTSSMVDSTPTEKTAKTEITVTQKGSISQSLSYATVFVAAVAAVSSIVLALINSGFLDEQLITHTRAHYISGISIYKKALK